MPYKFNPLSGTLDYFETGTVGPLPDAIDVETINGKYSYVEVLGKYIPGMQGGNAILGGGDGASGGAAKLWGGNAEDDWGTGGDVELFPGLATNNPGKVKVYHPEGLYNSAIDTTNLTGYHTINLPDKSGTLATMADLDIVSGGFTPVYYERPYYGLVNSSGDWEVRYSTAEGVTYAGVSNNPSTLDLDTAWYWRVILTYGTLQEAH